MSYAIALLALAEITLLVWAARRWVLEPANTALLLMLFILFPVCLDSTTIASGRWIGFGEMLETLNRVRFAWFVFCMPLMWAVCAAILRDAGFAWARPGWLVPALVVAARRARRLRGGAGLAEGVPPGLRAGHQTLRLRGAGRPGVCGIAGRRRHVRPAAGRAARYAGRRPDRHPAVVAAPLAVGSR